MQKVTKMNLNDTYQNNLNGVRKCYVYGEIEIFLKRFKDFMFSLRCMKVLIGEII